MTRPGATLLVLWPALVLPVSAFAAGNIEVTRGPDRTEYGSCVPSLLVENRSSETVDYLEVDLALELADGGRRTVELKSAYHEGVLYPIAPGVGATLRQHLDTSQAIGVPCGEIKRRTVERTICEAHGKACASAVSVRP
jgi:hypothetical protein